MDVASGADRHLDITFGLQNGLPLFPYFLVLFLVIIIIIIINFFRLGFFQIVLKRTLHHLNH